MKQVKITVSFEIPDDFYTGERKTKRERIKQYEEDFSDIEVLVNHIPKSCYDVRAELRGA